MKRMTVFGILVGLGLLATAGRLAAQATLTTLHTFTRVDGSAPEAGLVFGTNGLLYGTTFTGGTGSNCVLGCGTVFQISTTGAFTSLHSFTNFDGSGPLAELLSASDGNLYGTTAFGGFGDRGTIFRMTTSGVLTPIAAAPGDPESELMEGQDGELYGTSGSGGTSTPGTVYRISTNGLVTLIGGVDQPKGGLVQDAHGILYGTSEFGGQSTNCPGGCGAVFMVITNNPADTLATTIHSFNKADGSAPLSTLVLDEFGNLYGTTKSGGLSNNGTVFMITTNGALVTLHSFTGSDGKQPSAGVIFGADGKLYGTTASGGSVFQQGTVFQITTNGDFTKLVTFTAANGGKPLARLVQGPDDAFYGTTEVGGVGTNAAGTVFKLTVGTNSTGGCPPITLSPASLPDGAMGVAYHQTITASGGAAPRQFAVSSGALPSGLALSNAGTLSGTPTATGASGFTVTATDANDCTGSQEYTLTINPASPVTHDFVVSSLKAPKKVTLKAGVAPKPGKVVVTIKNAGTQTETITAEALPSFVALQIVSLGGCAVPVATLQPPKVLPVVMKPGKSLNLTYLVTVGCANDPTAGAGHEDYRYTVTVNPSVLDGNPDSTPADDVCPRPPNPATGDKGCGNKDPATKVLGAPVVTDVLEKP